MSLSRSAVTKQPGVWGECKGDEDGLLTGTWVESAKVLAGLFFLLLALLPPPPLMVLPPETFLFLLLFGAWRAGSAGAAGVGGGV